jgi:alpha-L-fucosidase
LLLASSTLRAQVKNKGDKEEKMYNQVQSRDRQAIDEAVNGWWKASMRNHDERIAWWREARFGMFIHWGIYSLAGGEWNGKNITGYAEHLMRKEKIPRSEYLKLAHQFDPAKFNADTWVLQAKKAGMRYIIITAKHHDGFAMYDSKVTDYNIVQQTPFHRDPMAELSAACKKYGLRFGFYYSHAFDWEDPNAPGNDWDYHNPGGDSLIGGAAWYNTHPEWIPRIQKYINGKAIPQIKELLTKYHPDILWFDTPQKLPISENIRILKAIREIDSTVVVNGRLVADTNFGDYKNTADRPAEFYPVKDDWEAIPTTNESYGYSKYDTIHKPASFFIQLLASAASRGGNLLLNIGPKGDGSFDSADTKILNGIGEWMDKNSASIYGTQRSPLSFQSWGVVTFKANKLYLHVFNWPNDGKLYVGGLNSLIKKAVFLASPNISLQIHQQNGKTTYLQIPLKAPDTVNTVIVLSVTEPVKADSVRYISTNVPVSRILAYDATMHGKKFDFADGKANRYYLEGWQTKDQYLDWTFRTDFPAIFQLLVKYVADNSCGGSYKLSLDNYQIQNEVEIKTGRTATTQTAGTVTLQPGIHHLRINAENITGKQLMKLLEIQLISNPIN